MLKKQGITILLTTHYMEEAYQICDEIIIMHKGEKIMEAPPKEMLKKSIEEHVLEVIDSDSGIEAEYKVSDGIRIDKGTDMIRYYSNDINLLKDLADNHLKDSDYLIRHTNLEDVFLKATGRHLSDKQ